jgi:hypothetical protein
MKNIIIILLMAVCFAQAEKCTTCLDDARQAQDAYKMVLPSAALGLGSALILVGINHALGFNKHIDDGWFITLPLAFTFYELGTGVCRSARIGIDLSHSM